MVFKNLNFDSMLYLLTIFVDSQDHSLYKSITIFLISFFSNTFSAISGGGAGLFQLPALNYQVFLIIKLWLAIN